MRVVLRRFFAEACLRHSASQLQRGAVRGGRADGRSPRAVADDGHKQACWSSSRGHRDMSTNGASGTFGGCTTPARCHQYVSLVPYGIATEFVPAAIRLPDCTTIWDPDQKQP